MKGLVHIYCGDGKGKSTAAIGLAIRCAGCGGHVLYASFLKDNSSGERAVLSCIENIELMENPVEVKFYKFMNEHEKNAYKGFCKKRFKMICEKVQSRIYDILILDEIIPTVNNEILTEIELAELINNRPENLEIVLTGRNPSDLLCSKADYITEMKKIKHPYDLGVQARKFIEM